MPERHISKYTWIYHIIIKYFYYKVTPEAWPTLNMTRSHVSVVLLESMLEFAGQPIWNVCKSRCLIMFNMSSWNRSTFMVW